MIFLSGLVNEQEAEEGGGSWMMMAMMTKFPHRGAE